MGGLKDFVYNSIISNFSNFQGKIDQVAQQVVQSPESFNPTIWSIINGIHNAFLPMAYSLLALFFLIELTSKAASTEVTQEQVIKVLIKTVFLKAIVEKTFYFLGLIFQLSVEATNKVNAVTGVSYTSTAVFDQIRNNINSMGTMDLIMYYISIAPLSVVMQFVDIAITLILFGRLIEIYMYTAFSPIPISTLANSELQSGGKNFLLSYAAVCFQGVIILIGCKIYGGMVQSMSLQASGAEALKNIVIMTLLLLFILIRSGTWAKKITGAT